MSVFSAIEQKRGSNTTEILVLNDFNSLITYTTVLDPNISSSGVISVFYSTFDAIHVSYPIFIYIYQSHHDFSSHPETWVGRTGSYYNNMKNSDKQAKLIVYQFTSMAGIEQDLGLPTIFISWQEVKFIWGFTITRTVSDLGAIWKASTTTGIQIRCT